jgi:signal recognition particle receptor subunit beta
MLGFVVLLDSVRPETFREARSILDTFRSYAAVPYVVAANKQDQEDAWSAEDLRIALHIPQDVKVVPCVAIDRDSVQHVVLELLFSVLELLGEEDQGGGAV